MEGENCLLEIQVLLWEPVVLPPIGTFAGGSGLNQEDLRSNLGTHVSQVRGASVVASGSGDLQVPGACWPGSLAASVSSGISERPCLKNRVEVGTS